MHAASLAALQEADLRPLLADPRLELLLIPKGWWGFDDVLALVDGSDGMLELTGVHVAYPGEQRTTIGIIERLEGHDWPATLRGWDEFFVAGMRENLANAEELVRDLTVDGETRAADERYIHDASAALARAETGDHPVCRSLASPQEPLPSQLCRLEPPSAVRFAELARANDH